MQPRTVLKEHQVYLVCDENGDISAHNSDGHGLYWKDTRFLSRYELEIAGLKPALLSAAGEYSFMNNFQCANPAFRGPDGRDVPARTISIRRNRFLRNGLHERIGFFNYNPFPVTLNVTIAVGSDFRDMFDVRGYTSRATHGRIEPPVIEGGKVLLRYHGLDRIDRATEIQFSPAPDSVRLHNVDLPVRIERQQLPGISGHGDMRSEYRIVPPSAEVQFQLELPAKERAIITVHVVPMIDSSRPADTDGEHSLDALFLQIRDSYRAWETSGTHIETDHEILNAIIRGASHDLRLLCDQLPMGFVPSAGIPWFSVPFGRDSLITSLQTLMLQPEIAYGTLRFLAQHQGTQVDEWRDEEPGKILHEVRMGEVASLGEVPHTPYYGSVDSTPLFLMTVSELLQWTDDLEFARELRPNIEAALDWLDRYGDRDGDDFVEYATRSPDGIRNQGWKDSVDAVAYPDGRLVDPPIALAEVQGYVYRARLGMAEYFRRIGEPERAAVLEERAARLKQRFRERFWLTEENFVAMALDAAKRPVAVISSNPGHCLWTGLVDGEDGLRVARRLLQEDLDCGWGIRTLSSREAMFNPMSYHNGSVWPHDTAIAAAGLKRLGLDTEAAHLVSEVLEAAMRFPRYRLPELYCGFARDRRYYSMPAQYPVSCSPQAWAAGSVFMMLQTLLGFQVDARRRRLVLRPHLPEWLNRVAIRYLRVADRRVDFEVRRVDGRTRVEIWDSGGLDILVQPATTSYRVG